MACCIVWALTQGQLGFDLDAPPIGAKVNCKRTHQIDVFRPPTEGNNGYSFATITQRCYFIFRSEIAGHCVSKANPLSGGMPAFLNLSAERAVGLCRGKFLSIGQDGHSTQSHLLDLDCKGDDRL